uniref:F-box/kelch-repeat protein SKIP30 n=1 Tax=Anthurium amnicola TaxID=1678845 RepID=A0A1D1YY28_9ARAE
MSGLIDGLPDAVALQCLARVPFCFHSHLKLVCRSWRAALSSSELFKARCEAGATEEFLCALAFEPENVWQLYDPLRDLWLTLPVLPTEIRHLARFGVASVYGKLFVLGGGSDRVDPSTGDHDRIFATNEVWSYDPFLCQWKKQAPMLVPRAMFACCALDGKIVVAGGFTNCRESISKAEIYDVEKDVWHSLPDLCHTRDSACSGLVINGKMHVLHKGISTVQILEDGGSRWAVEDHAWLQGSMAVVRGELYSMSVDRGELSVSKHCAIAKHQNIGMGKMVVVASASDFQSRIGYGMIGLGDELYVIGGLIGPGRMNQLIKSLADVDVLTVGSERPTWRQVAPMTHCHGSILGCTLMRV